jgi:macrolide-specific efflux system membrane fusion protein
MSKKLFLIGIPLISGLVVIWLFFQRQDKTIELPLKKGDVIEAIYGLGTVESHQVYALKIGVLTKVEKLFVVEGQRVSRGAPLVQFEGTGTFKAPFDGTLTLIKFREGEIVLPQMEILKLINLEDKYIEVSLEQGAAMRIQRGQVADITFEGAMNKKYKGKVESLFPRNNEFVAKIVVNDLDSTILPAMSADVVIEVGKKSNVLLVPLKSITNGYVLRLRDGHKKKIEVKLGNIDNTWGEVVGGDLLESDLVLVKRR